MNTISFGDLLPDDDWRIPGKSGGSQTYGSDAVSGILLPVGHEPACSLARGLSERSRDVKHSVLEASTTNRDRVANTRQYPFSAICALRMIDRNKKPWGGTGFLIGERLVLTAGHNVFRHDLGGPMERVSVFPGLNGSIGSPPFPAAKARFFHTCEAWVKGADPEMDFAAIELSTPLGKEAGYFSLANFTQGTLGGLAVTVSGYPTECPDPQNPSRCGAQATTQWLDQGNIRRVEPSRLLYEVETSLGQSGSPVFAYFPDKIDKFHAVGIHNYGDTPFNIATRISRPVFDMIATWLNRAASN